MLTKVRKSLRREEGQGMTEYIIIVILIALAVLIAVRFLGGKVQEKTSEAGEKVGGLTIPQ
jgi:Flp pilus assembly pilin Flp